MEAELPKSFRVDLNAGEYSGVKYAPLCSLPVSPANLQVHSMAAWFATEEQQSEWRSIDRGEGILQGVGKIRGGFG